MSKVPTITAEQADAHGYTPAMKVRFVRREVPTQHPHIVRIERTLQQLHLAFVAQGQPCLEAWVDVPLEDE